MNVFLSYPREDIEIAECKEIPKLPYHLHSLHYIVLDEENVSVIEAELLKAIAQFAQDEDIWQ